jgi:hypothetical protein
MEDQTLILMLESLCILAAQHLVLVLDLAKCVGFITKLTMMMMITPT